MCFGIFLSCQIKKYIQELNFVLLCMAAAYYSGPISAVPSNEQFLKKRTLQLVFTFGVSDPYVYIPKG